VDAADVRGETFREEAALADERMFGTVGNERRDRHGVQAIGEPSA
jgi:hypothetical protein